VAYLIHFVVYMLFLTHRPCCFFHLRGRRNRFQLLFALIVLWVTVIAYCKPNRVQKCWHTCSSPAVPQKKKQRLVSYVFLTEIFTNACTQSWDSYGKLRIGKVIIVFLRAGPLKSLLPARVLTIWNYWNKRTWLRHYATSWKVAGSSPDEVDLFNLPNPSSRTMALGTTQPLIEMSTRNLPGG
jgi:hypothetical protein